jgi:hypothetical protein
MGLSNDTTGIVVAKAVSAVGDLNGDLDGNLDDSRELRF